MEMSIYNRLFVFEPPSHDEFTEGVAWLQSQDVPSLMTCSNPAAHAIKTFGRETRLLANDGEPIDTEPGMVLTSLESIPSNESTVTISEVTTKEDLGDFVTVASAVFEIPERLARRVYHSALDASTDRLFVGRRDDRPVACGLLVPTGDVAGLYSLGVVESVRRRGIGEAMSWHLLRCGREVGCRIGTLQASKAAQPLYEDMGFETVVTYHHFEPAGCSQ